MAFITETLLMDGVWWILIGASLAGLVRGFTGFGTAMVFLPFANAVMGPVASLLMLISMDIFGPLPLIPNAIRKGHPKDIALMGIGMLMTLPLGIYLLSQMDSTFYRYVVSIATLSCVALLISGLRYRRSLTTPVIIGTGGLGGFLGGFAGVPGPPVMVLYMASRLPAETIRANLILFLLMADLLIFPIMALQGMLSLTPIVMGLIMVIPYMLGSWIGAALFDPAKEKVYRVVAYCVIAGSAIVGLPFWMG